MMVQIKVRPGRTLWEELVEQNIVIERPCGGRGSCGRCLLTLRDGRQVLACQYRTPGEVEIEAFPEGWRHTAVGILHGEEMSVPGMVAAVDIGTTTVALQLLNQDYKITRNYVNPQRIYGADVMSRIRAAEEGHGEELRQLLWASLREALASALDEFAAKTCGKLADGEARGGCPLVVSANTTMQHLLEGLSCRGLGAAPFAPESLELRRFFMDGEEVIQLPGISAFVGADIVSGLAVIDILHRDAPVLFVDLGTNGEMALGCHERLLVASTAAGPAFEGSELAVKIHGAGILRLLHELLERGVMDAYGTLNEEYFDSGYPVRVEEYRKAGTEGEAEEAARTDALCMLTQEDVRALQMAKAAVCAGVELLLETYRIPAEQVERVYLAGAFGYYLDPEDALAVGLLPAGLRGRIVAVGNTSLEGAVRYASRPEIYGSRMEEICMRAELLSLPDHEDFEERYIERMNFGLYSG